METILSKEKQFCPYCVTEHEVVHKVERDLAWNRDLGIHVFYDAIFWECPVTGEWWETEEDFKQNSKNIAESRDTWMELNLW